MTSSPVHVICAPPNGRNPGMSSVDMAFAEVAKEVGVSDVVYWRLWDQSEWTDPPGGSTRLEDGTFWDPDSRLTYRPLRGNLEEALDAPCVVYWGDFMHMAVYQRHNVDVLTRRMNAYVDPAEAARVVARHLMLRGRSAEELGRVLSFGSTLSFNAASDYVEPYTADLAGFVAGAHRVWFRDSYSAQVAALSRVQREEVCKGVDAAFLLKRPPAPPPRDETLGVFFGRSALPPEPLARFGHRLSTALGLAPRWIAWGREPAFWPVNARRRFRFAWPGLEHASTAPPLHLRTRTYVAAARGMTPPAVQPETDLLLDQLARCALVVTDTYHVAINAWRVGTPAICIVDRPRSSWSVNSGELDGRRDKREDLYSQLDALGLLVAGTGSLRNLDHEVDRVRAHLADPARVELVHLRVDALTARSRAALSDAIGHLVQRERA